MERGGKPPDVAGNVAEEAYLSRRNQPALSALSAHKQKGDFDAVVPR
jgi:hypothetical protein